ncbi:hypothetical protein ACJX0J_017780, partial [Zea mays]
KKRISEKKRNFICCMEFAKNSVILLHGVLNYCTPQCLILTHRLNHTFVSGYLITHYIPGKKMLVTGRRPSRLDTVITTGGGIQRWLFSTHLKQKEALILAQLSLSNNGEHPDDRTLLGISSSSSRFCDDALLLTVTKKKYDVLGKEMVVLRSATHAVSSSPFFIVDRKYAIFQDGVIAK